MFFTEILSILIEAYLEILFVSWLNLNSGLNDPDRNMFNTILASTLIFLILLMLPLCIFYLIFQSP